MVMTPTKARFRLSPDHAVRHEARDFSPPWLEFLDDTFRTSSSSVFDLVKRYERNARVIRLTAAPEKSGPYKAPQR